MLIYIGTRRQTYLLRTMRRDERMPEWQCHTYPWLFRTRRLPAATYVFTGVDRLDPGERRLAAMFYRHINAQGAGFRALNDPAIGMGRFRLLRTLHERGINDFNVYLATENLRPTRYPVFVRRNSSSIKPLTGLIQTRAELDKALDDLIVAGEVAEDLIIIEYYTEEFAPGIHAKFSQFRFGDTCFPNATLFSNQWFVKAGNMVHVEERLDTEDRARIDENPFSQPLMEAFKIAGIEYGRADFGLVGNRPQIFEINYNPELVTQREKPRSSRLARENRSHIDDLSFKALHEIDSHGSGAAPTIRGNAELRDFRLRFWRNYAPQRY